LLSEKDIIHEATRSRTKKAKRSKMDDQTMNVNEEREYPHWGRVYVGVIVYTAALIVALWAFSQMFE
jgi:hypothetical protein